jgi:hypothetical protein
MKRSWVLADGDIKARRASSSSSSPTAAVARAMPAAIKCQSRQSIISSLSPEDEHIIQDCIQKMQIVNQQTEDLNPQVYFFTEKIRWGLGRGK